MLKAIIFDFDGVITDSEPVHLKMFQKVLGEMDIPLNEEEYYEKYLGMDDKGCFAAVLQSHGVKDPSNQIQSLIGKKTGYLMEYIKNDLFIFPGVKDFIKTVQSKYRLAIASGALRHEIEFVLRHASIYAAFDFIVSAEDVRYGKPDPECFNTALERLNGGGSQEIRTDECLVIEDSIAGIEAAHAAGMKCIAVANTYERERLTMAEMVVKNLSEIKIAELENL